ncbi:MULTISPECIES: hypothetical protein [unclassified Aminobacter]|uniref:hypothetical protein n=1 Tax=unclassified Aminobacter TaxID=2644704 RepID=UPI0004654A68|nr:MULTISPECIES: hypothetical protein [unclassified Aminobacter]TWH35578.1 hypothetical protein L611_001200000590 [Aminobacter sp. J15]
MDTKPLNGEQALIEFIEKFEASRDPALWAKLIREELEEVEEAFADFIKELVDLGYVMMGFHAVTKTDKDVEDNIDEEMMAKVERFSDLLPFINMIFSGVGQRAFKAVHESNMSKLGDDGKPIRREDGKILKGPNYKAPDIRSLIWN